MRSAQLSNMIKGWFIGDFEPSVVRTTSFEVAVKSYRRGEFENKHHHKIATEITVVIFGKIVMCEKKWGPGSIICLEPGESSSFKALRKTVTVVVKSPSLIGDKYFD